MNKKNVLAGVLLLLIVGVIVNLCLSLLEPFYWTALTIGSFLWLIDILGSLILLVIVGHFFRLVKVVFGKISIRQMPEIIWTFFIIVPHIAKNNIGTLITLWKKNIFERREK